MCGLVRGMSDLIKSLGNVEGYHACETVSVKPSLNVNDEVISGWL